MPFKKTLCPKKSFDLIRIGKNNDGGYLVDRNSFLNAHELISLGVNDDWSFEQESLSLNSKLKIQCFDDKLDIKFLLKKIFFHFLVIFYKFKFRYIKHSLSNFISYLRLRNKISFKKKYIHYGDLNKIIKKSTSKNIFLKIDIEGGEYRILNELLINQDQIIGLAIEFHDIDLHQNKIYDFIDSLNLELVHIHGNNYARNDLNGDITVVELTFGRFPKILDEVYKTPNKLDMPNNPKHEEVSLNFE